MYKIEIKRWSATDYAFLVNNNLGYVSDDEKYWEFETEEEMKIFEKYLNGGINE